MPAWPDVVGNGAVSREETLRMPGGFEPLHVVLALPRRTMGVLTPVIQIATLAVFDPGQDLPLGRTITLYFIRDDYPWHVLQALEQRAETLLRRVLMASPLHENVEHGIVLMLGKDKAQYLTACFLILPVEHRTCGFDRIRRST
jgi:hypothetical protein